MDHRVITIRLFVSLAGQTAFFSFFIGSGKKVLLVLFYLSFYLPFFPPTQCKKEKAVWPARLGICMVRNFKSDYLPMVY